MKSRQRLSVTQTQTLSLTTGLLASIKMLRTDAAGLTRYLDEHAAENPYLALERPVTVLTLNSEEVVAALAAQKAPGEMNHGDVFKIHMLEHVDVQIQVNWL